MSPGRITIVRDPSDSVAQAPCVGWAVEELQAALRHRGAGAVTSAIMPARTSDGTASEHTVLVAGPASGVAAGIAAAGGLTLPREAEAFALATGEGGTVTLAAGADPRGLVYAVLELADRVSHAGDATSALVVTTSVVERPASAVRSVMRLFSSDVHDRGWFQDHSWWGAYLTELVTHRFNRFNLALGLGYDFPRGIRDAYFYFPYPFLLDVPGFAVRVTGLPDGEREKNLAALRFIGEEVKRRGMHFQLGLWTHAFQWQDSPDANHTIEGLAAETHAAYCRDAVRLLLQEVPTIDGITFRIHGESGVPEQSYDFWKTVFEGVASCGRPVELDLHAKGIDERMIGNALVAGTGAPVNVSPKFWAEHLGLPYHQAEIRELEQPREPKGDHGRWMALSEALRRFIRYGYGDVLREDREYGLIWRVWPGTQRLLLWGDPLFAAGYGRAAHFGGSLGIEFFEPLSFKGRKGSGVPGHRGGYATGTLQPPEGDWAKYRYTYRLMGRHLFNPAADPDQWRRYLRHQFGESAGAAEEALAHASRILPLVTVAHHPSAANYHYWPEMYTDVPIVAPMPARPYGDTPQPKRFGTVSPLDPALFSTVEQYADEVVEAQPSGRYSPLDVARWLTQLAATAEKALARWRAGAKPAAAGGDTSDGCRDAGDVGAEAQRWQTDIAIQAALGRFFAGKLRAGTAHALYERTGIRSVLEEGVAAYREARASFIAAAGTAREVYLKDLTFGPDHWLRGTWQDRVAAIDEDLEALVALLDSPPVSPTTPAPASPAWLPALEHAQSGAASAAGLLATSALEHTAPFTFHRGREVHIRAAGGGKGEIAGVRLHYRHVNHAERYEVTDMESSASVDNATHGSVRDYRAIIPASYTDSPYLLQYFFEVRASDGGAWLSPGLGPDLVTSPYHLLRQAASPPGGPIDSASPDGRRIAR